MTVREAGGCVFFIFFFWPPRVISTRGLFPRQKKIENVFNKAFLNFFFFFCVGNRNLTFFGTNMGEDRGRVKSSLPISGAQPRIKGVEKGKTKRKGERE